MFSSTNSNGATSPFQHSHNRRILTASQNNGSQSSHNVAGSSGNSNSSPFLSRIPLQPESPHRRKAAALRKRTSSPMAPGNHAQRSLYGSGNVSSVNQSPNIRNHNSASSGGNMSVTSANVTCSNHFSSENIIGTRLFAEEARNENNRASDNVSGSSGGGVAAVGQQNTASNGSPSGAAVESTNHANANRPNTANAVPVTTNRNNSNNKTPPRRSSQKTPTTPKSAHRAGSTTPSSSPHHALGSSTPRRPMSSPSSNATPPASPSSYCSRFIPSRKHSPFHSPPCSPHHGANASDMVGSPSGRHRSKRKLRFDSVSETMTRTCLGESQAFARRRAAAVAAAASPSSTSDSTTSTTSSSNNSSHPQRSSRDAYDDMLRREFWNGDDNRVLQYTNKRPVTSRILESPQKMLRERMALHSGEENRSSISKRKVASTPVKILDAPGLQDDFYLNLVDWGKSNRLAVGLSDSVYLWSAATCRVSKLCSLPNNLITSVSWMQNGSTIAVGSAEGTVLLYDVERNKQTRTLTGHTARVGCLSWNGNIISSGSRDRTILSRDIRVPQTVNNPSSSGAGAAAPGSGAIKLLSHKQEVCGLKWSPNGKELASGGNDNKLLVWHPSQKRVPMLQYAEHRAAVKGIAWSPHQHGLLASGGGTADRCIRFWNTSNGMPNSLSHIDTGSQVCNIAWSENCNELVSTHGYSQNQIVVWKYPSMTSIATLTGHTFRVLYLSMSPDGQTIVTGAGDETLRLWNVFPPAKTTSTVSPSSGYNITCVR